MKKIPSNVSADVVIHNFGKKPNPVVKAKIMAFIDAHKDETMQVTKETLPSPEEELRREDAQFAVRSALSNPKAPLEQRGRKRDEDGSSGGEASPGW